MTIIPTNNHFKENKLPGEETLREEKDTEGERRDWIREEEMTGRRGGFIGGPSLNSVFSLRGTGVPG